LESKASALETPSYLNQSRPNLKIWTPMRLNLMALRDYPNHEYKAELCNKTPLCTPEALLPTWTIYLLVVP